MDLHLSGMNVRAPRLEHFEGVRNANRMEGQCLGGGMPVKMQAHSGSILIDSETTLTGVPTEAWTYKLGNRSAIDWVLDQHREKKPKDPTIREHFDTYRFADHKERVIELLGRVVAVSVETVRIVTAIEEDPR